MLYFIFLTTRVKIFAVNLGSEQEKISPQPATEEPTESPSGGKEEELSLEERTVAPDDELPLVVESELPQPGTPEKVGRFLRSLISN